MSDFATQKSVQSSRALFEFIGLTQTAVSTLEVFRLDVNELDRYLQKVIDHDNRDDVVTAYNLLSRLHENIILSVKQSLDSLDSAHARLDPVIKAYADAERVRSQDKPK